MSVRVFYDILNQKGTPAMYTDTFANRPAYGYQGRLFISTDSGQIFEDTGSAWTLVADAGVGGGTLSSVCLNGNTTATGIVITAGGLSTNSLTNTSLTTGSILFADGGGLITQSNATFFWDNTNKRLGIGNNSPGAPLDIHGTGTNAHFNGTGSNNAYLVFQNAGVSKWRIGNTYSSGANTFEIYNNGLTNTALTINSSTNAVTLTGNLAGVNIAANGNATYSGTLQLKQTGGGILVPTGYLTLASLSTNNFEIYYGDGTGYAVELNNTLITGSRQYKWPDASGTLALTSNLSSYLPLTGGTLSGNLNITSSPRTTIYSETGMTFSGIGGSVSFLNVNNGADAGNVLIKSGTSSPYVSSILVTGNYADITNPNTNPGTIIFTTASVERSRITNGGNLLIGTTTDAGYKLDVSGTIRSTGVITGLSGSFINNTSGSIASIGLYNSTLASGSGGGYEFYYNSSIRLGGIYEKTTSDGNNFYMSFENYSGGGGAIERMRITSVGSVGIGNVGDSAVRLGVTGTSTSSAAYAFIAYDSTANALLALRNDGLIFTGTRTNSPYNYSTSGRSAILDSSGNFGYLVSTKESKSNIESIKNIDFINKLNPVQFNYRKKDKHNKEYTDELYDNITYGFIADEVEKVNKELAFYNDDGTLAGVEYNSMIAILTKAIQELNEKLVRNNIN
jgi:hypothetical protein